MTDISTILLCFSGLLTASTQRHLLLTIEALLSMSGRITLLGISRWTEAGGSYRTLQRFAANVLDWQALNWALFKHFILDSEDVILIAGDTTTVTKAGKCTYGLGRYFSSIYNRAVPGVSFLCLSLVSVKRRCAFPIVVEQFVKSITAKTVDTTQTKRKAGRPKGSRNKNQNKQLSESTRWIQEHLKALLERMKNQLKPIYFLYDNALGNLEGIVMCESLALHLISKLKCNSALWFPYEGEYSGRGAPRIYGNKLNYKSLPANHLKHSETREDILTHIYQLTVRHKRFPKPITVVIIQKTHLETQKMSQIILFSTDLELPWDKLMEYYQLRFQIEFNFRDAKQYWGLEDFMNVGQKQVHNMANLSLFMVNMSHALLQQEAYQGMSVLQLKAWFQAGKFVKETLKQLPQSLEPNLISQITQRACRFSREKTQALAT